MARMRLGSLVASVLLMIVPCPSESLGQDAAQAAATNVPPTPVAGLRSRIRELQATTPEDGAEIGRAYISLAEACLRDQQYGESRDSARRGIALLAAAPRRHPDSIRIREAIEEGHVVLGRAQSHLGDFVSAHEHLREALKMAQETSSCANRRVALRLHDLSILLACMSDVGDSLSPSGHASPHDLALYLSVLRGDEATLSSHRRTLKDALAEPEGASSLGSAALGLNLERLGAVCFALGDYEQSARYRALALASVSDHLGIQSPASIACAQNLVLTLIALDSSVTPAASALIRRVAAPTRMSLPRSHPLYTMIHQLAETCCIAVELRNEVDLYTTLFRLLDLPRIEPSPYSSVEHLQNDILGCGADPSALTRLLNACVGWYGPSMRALGTYRSLTAAHAESLRQVFGLVDPDGLALLGMRSVPATVTPVSSSSTASPSLLRLRVADAHGATLAVWTVLQLQDGEGAGLLIWDESLWNSSPQAMEAAVRMSSELAPSVLVEQGQKVARAIVAEEAIRVSSKAYPTWQSAVHALQARLWPYCSRGIQLGEVTRLQF
jgi:tetratricopeptide (TPR) repeat protein